MSQYQSYLQDCDCERSGIILKEGQALCRWCRKPYTKGGCLFYEDEHFREPLFITSDNVPIFDTETFYWSVDLDRFHIYGSPGKITNTEYFNIYKVFSTEEKAKEYVLMNKPCLSVNDLIKTLKLDLLPTDLRESYLKPVIDLIKIKIKHHGQETI